MKQISFALNLPEGQKINSSMGSIVHGALMELLPGDYVAELHEQGNRPFSQYLYWNRNEEKATWQLNLLDDRAERIIYPVVSGLQRLYLRQKDYSIGINVANEDVLSYEALADKVFLQDNAPKGVNLSFITATSFKRDGEYMIFPDIGMMINSLLIRWNQYSPNIKLEEDHLKSKLAAMCYINKYKLHSSSFSLEKQVVHGFSGTVNIRFRAADAQKRILGLLFMYSNYSGFGIKTALGMGGCSAELEY